MSGPQGRIFLPRGGPVNRTSMVLHPPNLPVFLCFACIGTPSHLLVFCVLYAEPQSTLQATPPCVRCLTDPASLSKDASVSNEHLQEIAREAHVSSLFDGRSDSDSECAQPHSVLFSAYSLPQRLLLLCLCPVFCLLNSLPPCCVFVCLLASALPPTCLCFVFSPIHRPTSRQKNAAQRPLPCDSLVAGQKRSSG
jgi:hypothetical protein